MEYITTSITILMICIAAFWFIGRPILVILGRIINTKGGVPLNVFATNGVSVVVPCHNEEDQIESTVASLIKQKIDKEIEIILVENNSTDNTYNIILELAERYPEVRAESITTPKGEKAISHAINYGVEKSRFPVVFRVDADTRLKTYDTIQKAVQPIIDGEAILVASNVRIDNYKEKILTKMQAIEYFFSMELDRGSQQVYDGILCVSGAVQAFRKDKLEEIGGYNTDINMPEDMDLTIRLGKIGRVKMMDNVISLTDAPSSIKELAKQRHWWFYIGVVCSIRHWRGIGNPKHRGRGLVSLPLKVIQTFQGLSGILVKTWLILTSSLASVLDIVVWLTVIHILIVYGLMIIMLPLSRSKQGVGQWYLVPLFSLVYQPFLSVVKLVGLVTAIKALVKKGNKISVPVDKKVSS